MPRRAAPGDRLAIEAALSEDDLRSLVDACRLLGIPRERWQRVPALQVYFETLAAARIANRLQVDGGQCWEAGLDIAGIRLGLNTDTLATRFRRWPLQAFAPSTSEA